MFIRGASVLLALIVAINGQSTDRRFKKIIGGSRDSVLKRPYMVSIVGNRTLCSGSIISRYHVLTALHCVTNPNINYYVRSASDLINANGTRTRVRHVFRPLQLDLDVAVLLLDVPLQFSEKCQPITLPKDYWSRLPENREALVLGYGRTNLSDCDAAGVLQSANVTLIDLAKCIEKYANYDLRHPMSNELCTRDRNDVKGFCDGDSGGPLVVHDGEHNIQIGIASWAELCGDPDWPAVYANVSIALPWIDEVMARHTTLQYKTQQYKEIGGQFDYIKNHPYMVSISEFLTDAHCAESIISPRHILTSRSCVPDTDYYVYSATDKDIFGGISSAVLRVYPHDIIDVAILLLEKSLQFDENCKSITLLDTQNLQKGAREMIVPGWGMTQKRYYDHHLRSVFVAQISPEICNIYYKKRNLRSHEICATQYENQVKYCFVDRGGPLVTTVNGQEVQIGVASWSKKCSFIAWPYVYVNISSVKTWIDTTVKETLNVN